MLLRRFTTLASIVAASCVAGCAGAAGPGPAPPAAILDAPDEQPRPEAVDAGADEPVATCVRPEAAAVLDACAAAGEVAEGPLPGPEAGELLARAEEAWRTNRWADCAELHTRLARRHPDPAQRAESAYAAVLCVNNREEEALRAADERPGERPRPPRRRQTPESFEQAMLERLAPRAFTPTETAMAEAYARYECLAPEGDERVAVRYRRARISYVANRWGEAAALFRDLALGHPASELASFAASQWLDSLNVLATIDPRRRETCRAELARGVDALMANETLMRDEAFRDQMTQLQCGLWWVEAERLEAEQRWLEASDRLLQILERHGEACRQIGSHDQCELLYNAAVYADEGGDTARAITVRERLLATCGAGTAHDADRGGRGSEWAKRVVARLGDDYRATGAHAKAAEVLEGFARQWPGERDAIDALETAAGLRVGLGQADRALADMALFERNYGGRPEQRGRVASVVFTVGAAHLRAKRWSRAERHYAAFLERYRGVARPDEVIRATVALGAARWERGGAKAPRRDAGLEQAREAVALADAGAAPGEGPEERLARYRSMVSRGGETEETIAARLALLLDAVARARVRLGVGDPPEDALRPGEMSAEQAEQVLLGMR